GRKSGCLIFAPLEEESVQLQRLKNQYISNRMIKWIVPLAMSSAVVGSHAQTLTFLGEGGLVTSLELDELVLNAVDSYSSSSIQFRVFDLFPAGVGFTGSEFDSSSVDFAVNGTVT